MLPSDQLKAEIQIGAGLLTQWPGVRRIWVFGSAAQGRSDWRSDIDFAVEGLSESDYGQAWAELDETLKLPVDLVRWETAPEPLRRQIANWGKVLYES